MRAGAGSGVLWMTTRLARSDSASVARDVSLSGPASREFLRSIIDALSAHIAILDERSVVLVVNQAWKRYAIENGYRGTTFGVGAAYLSVCDAAASDGHDDACEVATGIRRVIAGSATSFRHHYRCDSPEGPRWYQARVTRFEVENERFIVVAHDDVTEIRLADEAARASDQRLRAVLCSAPIVLFALDREGVFTVLTGEGLRRAGLHEGQLVGQSIFEIFRAEPEILEGARRALRGEGFSNITRAYGRIWETRYSPLLDHQGTLVGTIGASFDVTERQNTEAELTRYRDHLEALVMQRSEALERTHEQLAQQDRLASLGTLAAGLGHDIANLILPMKCHLDALRAAAGPGVRDAHFAALREAMEFLRQLCDGLRLCAMDPRNPGNESDSSQTTDVAAWWKRFGPVVTPSIPKDVRLRTEFEPGIVLAIAPHQFSQAMLNLLGNASEAISGEGQITVRVKADKPSATATVEVRDNGAGMTAEVRRHAFEPFFTTKKRARSTGLGLSVVHSIVTSVGGSVTIDSSPDEGTTITLTLRLARRGSSTASAGPREAEETQVVAVTVPDERRCALWMQVLRAAGCTPVCADEGDPEDADVWLTTADHSRLETARRFIASGHARRVVVYGVLPDAWAALGARAVDEQHGLEGVRETLRIAASPVSPTAGSPRSMH